MKLKKYLLLCLLMFFMMTSCKSKKAVTAKQKTLRTEKTNTSKKVSAKAQRIINYAKTFEGTPYKYGGNTKRGMDCSGLTYRSFNAYDINLPRTTADLKTAGNWIDLKEVNVGDLVFFATKKNNRKVNHVGIVTNARIGNVEFIHASSSKGVIVSSLAEKYWYFAFVQARRVL